MQGSKRIKLQMLKSCSLIWMLCSEESLNKLKKINERLLQVACSYSDFLSSYNDLVANSKEIAIHIQSIKISII